MNLKRYLTHFIKTTGVEILPKRFMLFSMHLCPYNATSSFDAADTYFVSNLHVDCENRAVGWAEVPTIASVFQVYNTTSKVTIAKYVQTFNKPVLCENAVLYSISTSLEATVVLEIEMLSKQGLKNRD